MNQKKSFLQGAVILSVAGVLSKILGALYRIPLARLIGDQGMGLYQMAYPIYTTILALATAGIPVAISVLVSRNTTRGLTGDSQKLFRVSLAVLLVIGIVLSFLVMQSAHFIANSILKQPLAYYPIIAVAPAIIFASLMSVFRGYFQGYQSMMPTAVSQVIEQLFRVTAVLIFAVMLFPRGLEYAAAGATFGAVVGGIAGLIILIGYYIWFRKKEKRRGQKLVYSGSSSAELAKEMIRLAVPVSFGAVVLPLVQMLDAIIVPGRLMAIGYSIDGATALFGQLSGMAAVLISLPTIFTISIATSLVPAVSESSARGDKTVVNERLNYAFRAGMIIALPCAAGLYILAAPICDLLYAAPEAGIPLEPLAFSCIALAAYQLSSAGLQGLGRPEIAMRNLLITGILKVIFNYTLTGVPALNIRGAAIGTVLAFLIGSFLNLVYLRKLTGISYEISRLAKITAVTIVMSIAVKFSYQLVVGMDISSHLATVIAITIGVGVYGLLMLVIRELDLNMVKRLVKG